MKKLSTILILSLSAVAAVAAQNDYYTGYEGLVLGESAPRSATDAISEQAAQTPGDIYRGTVFGAEQKTYKGDILGDRPRATTKNVYDTSLIRAIKANDADSVRMLTAAHVGVNERNYAGITPLTVAAEKGNMEIIKLLVNNGANVNDKSSYGFTPLIAAASAGNNEVIDYLLAHGADTTAKDDLGKTAIIYASNINNAKSVLSLSKKDKYSVNLPDNSGNTPLIYAAQHGYVNHINTLLANGANPDYRNPETGISALSIAAAAGNSNMIRALGKNGKANLNISDLQGRTPIFYAIEQDKMDGVRALIILGADINVQDFEGETPLMLALKKKNIDCANLLLKQKNINVNLKDNAGNTAANYAAKLASIAPAQKLVAANVDLSVADSDGNTPLMNAVIAKQDRTALLFVQNNAPLTPINNNGENVFNLVDKYLPDSMTANVLSVKRTLAYQTALQDEAAKLAQVRELEQTLAAQEAQLAELKAEKEAEEKAAFEAKKEEVRSKLEQDYQTELESDPELARLQKQLAAAKARKEAALQQKYKNRLNKELGIEPTEEEKQAQAQAQAKPKAAPRRTATRNNRRTTGQRRATAAKPAAKPAAAKPAATAAATPVKETIPQATVAPQEVRMADVLNN